MVGALEPSSAASSAPVRDPSASSPRMRNRVGSAMVFSSATLVSMSITSPFMRSPSNLDIHLSTGAR